MFLNPDTSNYSITFSDELFLNKEITEKYNNYLYFLNFPIKDIRAYIEESIQTLTIPGYSLNNLILQGLNNLPKNPKTSISETTTNVQFPGTAPLSDIITDTKVTITMRNTLLNWLYFYEVFRGYYDRQRTQTEFSIIITLMDTTSIPIFNFVFNKCFISEIPSLEFSFNNSFNETKQIDVGISFNQLNAQFILPKSNTTKINI